MGNWPNYRGLSRQAGFCVLREGQTKTSILERPINKLCLLESIEQLEAKVL